MRQDLRHILRTSGLNQSEAKMLEKLFGYEEFIPVADIISQCGMTEFTGYRTARRLREQGLVEIVREGNRKHIRALPLDVLAKRVGREQRKLRRLEIDLTELTDYYHHRRSSDDRRGFNVYRGYDALMEHYDTIPERCKGEIMRGFGSIASVWESTRYDYYSRYEQEWIKRRIKNGIKLCTIDSEESWFQVLAKKDNRELRDTRVMPGALEPSQWTAVTDSRVFIFEYDPQEPVLMEITDRIIYRHLLSYYTMLWDTARKPEIC